MAEGPTKADKEAWELELLRLLVYWLNNELPATEGQAVADMMIVDCDVAPWDVIEVSKTDPRAWEALQRCLGWQCQIGAQEVRGSPGGA